jgi:hypothetical protein
MVRVYQSRGSERKNSTGRRSLAAGRLGSIQLTEELPLDDHLLPAGGVLGLLAELLRLLGLALALVG